MAKAVKRGLTRVSRLGIKSRQRLSARNINKLENLESGDLAKPGRDTVDLHKQDLLCSLTTY